ncbi:Phosphoglycolate phosphatase [uncultured archaeon]|nr:Phosphoglycolate phosphatase [uncultured archaeon]
MKSDFIVAFDLDGVILNSKTAYVTAFRNFMTSCGHVRSEADVLSVIGPPAQDVLRSLFPAGEPDVERKVREGDAAVDLFALSSGGQGLVVAVPGAADVLREVRKLGCVTAVVTNSKRNFIDATFPRFGLSGLFDRVLPVGEGPKEVRLRLLLSEYGVSSERMFYVGDLKRDADVARAVGAVSVIVYNEYSWLYPNEDKVPGIGADYVVSSLSGILPLLEEAVH